MAPKEKPDKTKFNKTSMKQNDSNDIQIFESRHKPVSTEDSNIAWVSQQPPQNAWPQQETPSVWATEQPEVIEK